MKISRIIGMCFAAVVLTAPWVWAQTRSVTFLPRDQEMESVSVDYTGKKYSLAEAKCSADTALYKFTRCSACMNARSQCPDCCVKKNGSDRTLAKKCTPDDNAKYTPQELVFNPDENCPAVQGCAAPDVSTLTKREKYCANTNLPNCQIHGCPGLDSSLVLNARPKTKISSDICYPDGTDKTKWICNTDNLDEPYYQGCTPRIDTYVCAMKKYGHQVVYDINPVTCPSAFTGAPSGGGGNNGNGNGTGSGSGSGEPPSSGTGGEPGSGSTEPPAPPAPSCYSYEFKTTYQTCVNKCITGSTAYEQYIKNSDCCLSGSEVCCANMTASGHCTAGVKATDPGYYNNCSTDFCDELINWPECQGAGGTHNELCCDNTALNDDKCLEYRQLYDRCFDPKSTQRGGCLDCFQTFGTTDQVFKYDFVARSNQKMIVLWQVHITPHYCIAKKNAAGAVISPKTCPTGAQDTGDLPLSYLYTMIKIFDVTNGNEIEVFPGTSGKGTLSQRAFSGAFSIFAASAVDKDDAGNAFFEQGRKYRVKLYWYIPQLPDYILSADVRRGEFTIIKVRE